ncbi:MAG: fold metallo-hydrolase [Betaproteobacteria bacterium]|nr:fold metallo-hydrolase [Betaproteobacteria bacterium]
MAISLMTNSCASRSVRAPEPQTVAVAAGVYAVPGTGGEVSRENGGRTANAAFIVGPRGVVVVDTGASYRQGVDIIAAVGRITTQPIRLAILTHPGQEVVFGAAAFQARGVPVLAHRRAAELIAARCETCLSNLRAALGEDAMAATRVIAPDRLIDSDETIDVTGRRLRLIVPPWSSVPGAIAVYDESTSTLIAGNLVSINRIPDIRDADVEAWRDTLALLASMRCPRLVPGYGPIATCEDARALARYFSALETRVGAMLNEGVSLAALRDRIDLPEFASWDQYETMHPQNANRTYLRLEWSAVK